MTSPLCILIVEPDRDRALAIVDDLQAGDDAEIHVIAEMSSLARRVAEFNPDIVIVDLTNPSRDMIE